LLLAFARIVWGDSTEPFGKPFDKLFDKLTVLNTVEGLVLSPLMAERLAEGLSQQSEDPAMHSVKSVSLFS
jgi:hypothetical protein